MTAWRTAEVRGWLASVPARWARPVWPTLVLLGAVVWAVLAVPEPKPAGLWPEGALYPGNPSATDRAEISGPHLGPDLSGSVPLARDSAAPLGQLTIYAVSVSTTDGGVASWWGWPTVFLGLLVLELLWIWRRPALALAVLVPLATGALISTDALGRTALPALVGVAVAAALAAVTLLHRRAVRVRQWERVAEAAGPRRHRPPAVPGGVRRSRRPYVLLAAAGVLLAVAAYTGWRATLYEGKWALLITGTLGVALLIEGVVPLLRSARLHRRTQPALRVLVGEGADGRTWVYAADDSEGREPLLGFRSWGGYEGGHGADAAAGATGGAAGDDGGQAGAAAGAAGGTGGQTGGTGGEAARPCPLREAVLYGTPAVGAELVYVAAVEGPGGRVAVEHSTTPAARRNRPGHIGHTGHPGGESPSSPEDPTDPTASGSHEEHLDPMNHTDPHDPIDPTDPDPTAPGPAAASDAPGCPSWSAGPVGRTIGVLLLLAEIGVVWSFLDGDRGWRVWFALLVLPFSLGYVAAALNWRVTADRAGLWIAGGWRVRHLRWAEVEKVEYDEEGIRFRGPDGIRAGIRPTGWARLDRRTAKGHQAARAAAAIRAMLADPALRPARDSTPAEQGMPLGPVIALLTVLGAVAVLMLG
ncbi:hypothetical protein ACFYVL_35035 [Streptomyces sp. NPDC004111]|uniref:hypothetical protein n=1 Tax=Streptomyces sp. NPDC004111 TaxID=3364690 RepID=UPI0036BFA08D